VVTAYSSFGPQLFLELPPAFRERAAGLLSLFDSEVIKKIAAKHGKTPSQVLLRFATQRCVPNDSIFDIAQADNHAETSQ